MSVLRTIESKIEGLFEGVFGRAFRTNVQPIELARWLAREMDQHRSVSVSRVYVPNEFTVYLAPSDRAQFSSYEGSLIGELQEYLAEHARREGYALLTPPKVIFATDPDLAMGESGVAARVVQPPDGLKPISQPALPAPTAAAAAAAAAGETVPAATMVYRSAESVLPTPASPEPDPEPEPAQEIVTLSVNGRELPIRTDRVVIGRSRECDVRVDDANASRRHAELHRTGGSFWLSDLGSTNGTELNGKRVQRSEVADGDVITIGSTELRFTRRVT
jgi:hypothetical protein